MAIYRITPCDYVYDTQTDILARSFVVSRQRTVNGSPVIERTTVTSNETQSDLRTVIANAVWTDVTRG